MKLKLFISIIIIIALTNSCEDILDLEDTGDPRDRIIDTWLCNEDSEIFKSVTGSYYVDISKDPNDSTKIVLDNFYQLGIGRDLKARLNGKTLTIINQNIEGYIFNGSGTITSNYDKISWTYKVEHTDGDIDNVTAVFVRM